MAKPLTRTLPPSPGFSCLAETRLSRKSFSLSALLSIQFFFLFLDIFPSKGKGVSDFCMLNMLCFADNVFPSRNRCVVPLLGAWGQSKGSRSSGWNPPSPGWGLPCRGE